MKAVRIHAQGGPEVLVYEEVATPQPGPGEALVRVKAAGLNYLDIYHRSGVYAVKTPFTLGQEGAGVVEAVGEGAGSVKVGDRVAWCMHGGGYAEYAVLPAWKLVPLPANISFEMGAAIMLQGLTAEYLTHSTFPLGKGHRALVHAAAGGVGLLLVQIAKRLGATVYGTVGNREKAQLALEAGTDEAILYNEVDFAAEVRRLTDGAGVDVVYDSVGQSTFMKSLESLRTRGLMVSYGQSSGVIPPVETGLLSAKGSLFLTRPTLAHYAATRAELLSRSATLLGWVGTGELKVRIDSTYPLAEVAAAHRRIESRASTGKILLVP